MQIPFKIIQQSLIALFPFTYTSNTFSEELAQKLATPNHLSKNLQPPNITFQLNVTYKLNSINREEY
jgi:hypothetical protein